MVAGAGGIVEKLIYQAGRRRDVADREGQFTHALQRQRKGFHVGNFASHQKLERVLRASVVTEIDESLIDDLGPRFGGNVAAEIHVKLAGNLKVVRGPGVALRIE